MNAPEKYSKTTFAALLLMCFTVFFLAAAQPANAGFLDWFGFGGSGTSGSGLDGKWGTGPSNINMANTGLAGMGSSIFGQGIVNICDDTYPRYQGVTKRVVHCIQDSVIWGTMQYFDGVYGYLKGVIYAFFTLVVVLFGVSILSQSVENISRDSFLLVVKLAVVMGLLENMDWLYISVVDIMEGLLGLVVQFGVSGYGFIQCPFDAGIVFNDVWFRVDCMLDTLIGIGNKGPGIEVGTGPAGLSRGLLNFFVSSAPGSALGLILLVMGFYVIFTLAMAIARAMQVYILGFLGVSFMMAVGPIFIPLLVLKQTKDYFDKWAKIILAFILQPVILFAFINMSMIAIDIVMVGGEDSFLRTVAGDRVLDSDLDGWVDGNFNINTFLEDNDLLLEQYSTFGMTGANFSELCGQFEETIRGLEHVPLANDAIDGVTCGEDGGVQLPFKMVDYRALADIRANDTIAGALTGIDPSATPEEQAEQMRAIVTTSALIMLLCAFLFMSMLNYIPAMAHDLSGGAYETPNLYYDSKSGRMLGGELPFQTQLQEGAREITTGIRGAINSIDGGAVAGGIASAGGLAAGIYGALDGVTSPDSVQRPADRVFTFAGAAEMLDGKVVLDANGNPMSAYEAYQTLSANDLREIARSDESVIQLDANGRIPESTSAAGAAATTSVATVAGATAIATARRDNLETQEDQRVARLEDLAREQTEELDLMQRREAAARQEGIEQAERDRMEQERLLLEQELEQTQREIALREMEERNVFSFGGASSSQIQDVVASAEDEAAIATGLAAIGVTDTAAQYAAVQLAAYDSGGATMNAAASGFLSSNADAFSTTAYTPEGGEPTTFGAVLQDGVENALPEVTTASETSRTDTTQSYTDLSAQLEEQRAETFTAEALVGAERGDVARAEALDNQTRGQQAGYDGTAGSGLAAAAADREADRAERLDREQQEELTQVRSQLDALGGAATTAVLAERLNSGEISRRDLLELNVNPNMEPEAVLAQLEQNQETLVARETALEASLAEREGEAARLRSAADEALTPALEEARTQAASELTAAQEHLETERAELAAAVEARDTAREAGEVGTPEFWALEEAAREAQREFSAAEALVARAEAADQRAEDRLAEQTGRTTDDERGSGGGSDVAAAGAPDNTGDTADVAAERTIENTETSIAASEAEEVSGAEGDEVLLGGLQNDETLVSDSEEVAARGEADAVVVDADREATQNLSADARELSSAESELAAAGAEDVSQDNETVEQTEGLGASAQPEPIENDRADELEDDQDDDGTVAASPTPEERTAEAVAESREVTQEDAEEETAPEPPTLAEANAAYNGLQMEVAEREATQAQLETLQSIDLSTPPEPIDPTSDAPLSEAQLNAATDVALLQATLGTQETNLERLEEMREERIAEIEAQQETWAQESTSLEARVEAADAAREEAQREYERERAEEEAEQRFSEEAQQVADAQAEIAQLERRLASLEVRSEARRTVNPERAHERMVRDIVDEMPEERVSAMMDAMDVAQRDIHNIEAAFEEGGALARLSPADQYVALQGLAMQNPGQRNAILAAAPNGSEAAFREEFASQVQAADDALLAAERELNSEQAALVEAERAEIECQLEEQRATLGELGVETRASEASDGRPLIDYNEFNMYLRNVNLQDAQGNPVDPRDFYNSLSDQQLADMRSFYYAHGEAGSEQSRDYMMSLTASHRIMQYMVEHDDFPTEEVIRGWTEETPVPFVTPQDDGTMVLNTENLFTDETVEIPADSYVPEERSEMPYADFRAMTEEVRGGGPIYEREDGSVLSMAEAYDALNAAQLRQMRRLWEVQQAERDLSDAQAERMVRRMGAMNEGVSSSDFEAYMDAVRELTDAQDAAEARSLGIEPEEDE